jgi:phosphohistidine phosphatase
MLVGHNPGMEQCAALLAREPVRRKERARHEALEEKFPTCALAVLDFDVGRWRDVREGSGKLADFVRPGDL